MSITDQFWSRVTADVDTERDERLLTQARVASASTWSFLAQASTPQEFDDRLALAEERLHKAITAVVGNDPAAHAEVYPRLVESFQTDFDTLIESRRKEALARSRQGRLRRTKDPVTRARRAQGQRRTAGYEVKKFVGGPGNMWGIWDTSEDTWYEGDEPDAYYAAGVPYWKSEDEAQAAVGRLSTTGRRKQAINWLPGNFDYGRELWYGGDYAIERWPDGYFLKGKGSAAGTGAVIDGPFATLDEAKAAAEGLSSTGRRKQASGDDWLPVLRRIVENHQHETVDGTIVDVQSANAMLTVFDALNAENQQRVLDEHISFLWHITEGAMADGILASRRQAADLVDPNWYEREVLEPEPATAPCDYCGGPVDINDPYCEACDEHLPWDSDGYRPDWDDPSDADLDYYVSKRKQARHPFGSSRRRASQDMVPCPDCGLGDKTDRGCETCQGLGMVPLPPHEGARRKQASSGYVIIRTVLGGNNKVWSERDGLQREYSPEGWEGWSHVTVYDSKSEAEEALRTRVPEKSRGGMEVMSLSTLRNNHPALWPRLQKVMGSRKQAAQGEWEEIPSDFDGPPSHVYVLSGDGWTTGASIEVFQSSDGGYAVQVADPSSVWTLSDPETGGQVSGDDLEAVKQRALEIVRENHHYLLASRKQAMDMGDPLPSELKRGDVFDSKYGTVKVVCPYGQCSHGEDRPDSVHVESLAHRTHFFIAMIEGRPISETGNKFVGSSIPRSGSFRQAATEGYERVKAYELQPGDVVRMPGPKDVEVLEKRNIGHDVHLKFDSQNAAGRYFAPTVHHTVTYERKVATRKQAMPNPVDLGVSVGDFFYSSWGYDQTNVDFYEVVGLTAASVRLQEVAQRVEGSGVVPIPGSVAPYGRDGSGQLVNNPPPFTARIKSGYRGTPTVSSPKYISGDYAWLWDGTPKYDTTALGYPGH